MNVFRDNSVFGEGCPGHRRGNGNRPWHRGGSACGTVHRGCDSIASRNEENLQAAARQISESTGRSCLPVVADVRQPDAVGSAVNRGVGELGSLDLVINHAAGTFVCPSSKLSPNGFGTVIDIDAKGDVERVADAAYDAWLKDHGGQILNITLPRFTMAGPRVRHTSPPRRRPRRRG